MVTCIVQKVSENPSIFTEIEYSFTSFKICSLQEIQKKWSK